MSKLETGGCLCKNVSYQFQRDQVTSAHHCHCKDCQIMTGSGKATIVVLPTEALTTNGELKSYIVTGTNGSHIGRGFCPNCGSQLISHIEEKPHLRLVKVGSLDDSSWVTIDSSFWSCSAEQWSPVDSENQTFEKNPPNGLK